MRPGITTTIVFCLICFFTASSQSIYNIEYGLRSTNDQTTYHAFLLRYDDGGGLLRVRYTNAANEDIVKEMDIEEIPVWESPGIIDSNTTLLKPINQRTIVGNSNTKFEAPFIVLKYNATTDYFEPSAITFSETKPTLPTGAVFSVNFIDREKITKAFIIQFFTEDDDFFIRYFSNVTRGLSPAEKKTRLHLMIVADTLDKTIGSACAKNIQRITETFSELTNFLGIKLLSTLIAGKQYSKKNIEDALKKLMPAPTDIVVFYYAGHGFSIPEKPRRFPNLKLKNFPTVRENFRDSLAWARQSRKDNITYSMNIEDIFNTIKAKKGRFNLVISDCCNDDIFSVSPKGSKPGKTKASGVEWSEANLRQLFLSQERKSLLITAAQSGQRAACNDTYGSFFTYFFRASLESYCSKLQKPTTWDVVIQNAQKQTTVKASNTYCDKPYIPKNICKQEPDYKSISGN
jgi:hypothetical protein